MRVGLQIPHFRPSTPETMRGWFKDIVQAADEGGFYSVWVMDHFFQLGGWLGDPASPMVEGYTTLGYFAGLTEKVRLGLMVGGVIYRHPAIVVKAITTLDVLSGGRAYFGIGAAWYEEECKGLGLRFPSMKERFELLEEQLKIAHHMWSGDASPYQSERFHMERPVNNPQPLSKPHPPILIGGMGEQKTLRFVAQYADACNLFGRAEDDVLAHKLDVLKGHCEAVGRPYDEIEKTVLATLNPDEMSAADMVAEGRRFAGLGFSQVIFNLQADYTVETIQRIAGEVIPELAAL